MSEMVFNNGSVPVAVAAKVYKKDPCWVRAGMGNLLRIFSRLIPNLGVLTITYRPKSCMKRPGIFTKGR